jgi:hypothetical protein
MQVLDRFISLVRLDGGILILAVLVLARPSSDEPVSNLSVGASANFSKTQVQQTESSCQLDFSEKDQESHGEIFKRD